MSFKLLPEEQLKFSKIIFQKDADAITSLSSQDKQKLKALYDQKIAYDTANGDMKPETNQSQANGSDSSGVLGTICCCFNPSQNRDKFDITSDIFLKKILRTFLFFKSNFLEIEGEKAELYGFLWLSITYVVILGLAGNLNEYFILPENYQFNNTLLVKAFGLCALFLIAEPFIYKGVVKWGQGTMTNVESMTISGYSVLLYFIPALLCLVPSLYWHVSMLSLGGVIRSIFLWRNYTTKLVQKSFVMLGTSLIVQALFILATLRIIFIHNSGYNFSDGTKKVFGHYFQLRHFSHF